MWLSDYRRTLYHHGVKGMRWGYTKGAPNGGRTAGQRIVDHSVAYGHQSSPRRSIPNTTIDHISNDGTIDTRTYYNDKGVKTKDIHATNHGNPKTHNFGEHGEHVVEYEWNTDWSLKNKTRRNLTDIERKENEDIL